MEPIHYFGPGGPGIYTPPPAPLPEHYPPPSIYEGLPPFPPGVAGFHLPPGFGIPHPGYHPAGLPPRRVHPAAQAALRALAQIY